MTSLHSCRDYVELGCKLKEGAKYPSIIVDRSDATAQHAIHPDELFKYCAVSTYILTLAFDQYHKNVRYILCILH